MTPVRVQNASHVENLLFGAQGAALRDVLSEEDFRRMIAVERKRTERTNQPFLLMLLGYADHWKPGKATRILDNLMAALFSATRETDVIGWYRQYQAIGILFTRFTSHCKPNSLGILVGRVSAVLRRQLTLEQFSAISISLYFFPDQWDQDDSESASSPVLYHDLGEMENGARVKHHPQQILEGLGHAFLLLLSVPLFVVMVFAAEMNSRFRQQRVGSAPRGARRPLP